MDKTTKHFEKEPDNYNCGGLCSCDIMVCQKNIDNQKLFECKLTNKGDCLSCKCELGCNY